MIKFEDLKGKILISIAGKVGDEEITFRAKSGKSYRLYHNQSCCESVRIEDIAGDLSDLIDSPLVMAEEITNEQDVNPEGIEPPEFADSFTWTFYKLATIKGYVTIRWLGESNGYYSEEVDFEEM